MAPNVGEKSRTCKACKRAIQVIYPVLEPYGCSHEINRNAALCFNDALGLTKYNCAIIPVFGP
jgi:hypothetical protein